MTQDSAKDPLHTIKAKTARGKRFLEDREPKTVENVKKAMFVKGTKTSETLNSVILDLYSLKKPEALLFSKRNKIHPFEDDKSQDSLNFFSNRNDASLALLASHSKKRPNNLVFARMFDHQLYDLVELTVTGYLSIRDIKGPSCAVGIKPCFVFLGSAFESSPVHRQLKLVLLDFFRGTVVDSINLTGLESVIMVTADDSGAVYFRVYRIGFKKSGTKVPRVELSLLGPSIDLVLGRHRLPSDEMSRQAHKTPKELKPQKVKNIETTALGETVGRIHMQRQDFDSLQSRKVKALKKRKHPEQVEPVEEANEE